MHNDTCLAIKPYYLKILDSLENRAVRRGTIIPFPEVARVLSWFRFRRRDMHTVLPAMREAGLIEIIPFHGVRLVRKGAEAGHEHA